MYPGHFIRIINLLRTDNAYGGHFFEEKEERDNVEDTWQRYEGRAAVSKTFSAEVYPKGYRYRIHYKKIPGSPDIVFVKQKIAIFIDGDFWHGRGFDRKKSKLPKKYWIPKIEENIRRDRQVNRQLKKEDWKVIRTWESDVNGSLGKAVDKIEGVFYF